MARSRLIGIGFAALLASTASAASASVTTLSLSTSGSILLVGDSTFIDSTSVLDVDSTLSGATITTRRIEWRWDRFNLDLVDRDRCDSEPMPEPGAALCFGAGTGLVALHLRRRRAR